jgi:uncharacterized membrane protein YeiH
MSKHIRCKVNIPNPIVLIRKVASTSECHETAKTTALIEELKLRARALNLRVADHELEKIVLQMRINSNEYQTYDNWLRNRSHPASERVTLLTALWENHKKTPAHACQVVASFIGTSSLAAGATIAAGDVGMNIIGSTMVGCITGLGGGTLNNVMMGAVPVVWMSDMRMLWACIASCIVTFYAWPVFEKEMATKEISMMKPDSQGNITVAGFCKWMNDGGEFPSRLKQSYIERHFFHGTEGARSPSPSDVFFFLDEDRDGFVKMDAMRRYLRQASLFSPLLYAIDTVSLASLSIAGAQQGIFRGMHPVVCAISGVTICFGGLLRDLLTKRDVALGADSFALATGAGAVTLVGSRELMLRGWPISIGVRMGAAAAVVFGLRIVAWRQRPEPLLFPMFEVELPLANSSRDVVLKISK